MADGSSTPLEYRLVDLMKDPDVTSDVMTAIACILVWYQARKSASTTKDGKS